MCFTYKWSASIIAIQWCINCINRTNESNEFKQKLPLSKRGQQHRFSNYFKTVWNMEKCLTYGLIYYSRRIQRCIIRIGQAIKKFYSLHDPPAKNRVCEFF